MIRFENVSKRYALDAIAAVEGLSLNVEAGEICMLVGPSGCGKTTTMKMVNKLIAPTSGAVYVDGRNVEAVDAIELRLNIGYIIQDIGLFPHLTVAANIATVPIELGWKKARINTRIDELLTLVDLDPALYRQKKPRELSGGQKQRVGIARALAGDPPIMLMDEPFGALDTITRAKMQDEFLRIQKAIGKTIVFVTHDMEEAVKMGDRIAVLQAGRMLQLGTPKEILLQPANAFVSDLIGRHKTLKMMNLIRCEQIMRPFAAADIRSPRRQGAANQAKVGAISARATAQDALSEMLRTGERSLYVEDDDKVVRGVIDLDDLFNSVSQVEYGSQD